LEHPEPEYPFLGLYVMDLPSSRSGITSYSVEFKADQTARVLVFKEGRTEPEISHGNWLIAKDGIIILYFTDYNIKRTYTYPINSSILN